MTRRRTLILIALFLLFTLGSFAQFILRALPDSAALISAGAFA